MKIFITHCSATKDANFEESEELVSPEKLYAAKYIQRFMKKCKQEKVNWAVFSDLYGVWFPDIKHAWYEKNPNSVTEYEFKKLLINFTKELQSYDEIWFYHNPGRFHPLYIRLIFETPITNRITLFSHLKDINRENNDE